MLLATSLCLLLPQGPDGAPPVAEAPPLTADARAAMEVIDQRVVRAAVAFLASDELGGRDTPSPGLDTAAVYVAARFAGAQLEGLGAGGSYYLESMQRTSALPGAVSFTDENGDPLAHHGLLAVDKEKAVEFTGELVDGGTGLPSDGIAAYSEASEGAAVVVDQAEPTRVQPGWPRSFALLQPLRRQVREARRAKAIALLVRVPGDSPLIELVAQHRDKHVLRDRLNLGGLPVLLVPASQKAERVRLRVPPLIRAQTVMRNVCGLLRGSDPVLANEAIVVSAHLDHVGIGGSGEDRIHNGADDDATGVCGVLSLADAFSAMRERPKRSLLFVTFWGEEKGLLGSRQFCEEPPWPLEKIVANVNLEMIGRPEDGARHKAWMTGWKKSDLGELMAAGAKRAGVEIFRHARNSPMLYGSSDNASFVRRGVIAHSFSAGSLHEDYHKPGDEWQKLDLPHMTVVIRGLFAGTLGLADGDYTPSKR